jgi:hypothetical protein
MYRSAIRQLSTDEYKRIMFQGDDDRLRFVAEKIRRAPSPWEPQVRDGVVAVACGAAYGKTVVGAVRAQPSCHERTRHHELGHP